MTETVMRERARFDNKFKVGGGTSQKNDDEEEVDESWLKDAVEADKIKFEKSISQAELAAQELLDDGQGMYDSGNNERSRVERGRVATPQVSLPVPCTHVPSQTRGTANGSLVDEKEKTDHRSAHPVMHNQPTALWQADRRCCQIADQPSHSKVWPSPAPYQVRDTTKLLSLAKSSAVPSAGQSLAKSSAVPSAGQSLAKSSAVPSAGQSLAKSSAVYQVLVKVWPSRLSVWLRG